MRETLLDVMARLLGVTVYIDGIRHGAKICELERVSMKADFSEAMR
jgi:hypothetical protein